MMSMLMFGLYLLGWIGIAIVVLFTLFIAQCIYDSGDVG